MKMPHTSEVLLVSCMPYGYSSVNPRESGVEKVKTYHRVEYQDNPFTKVIR
jgi:hypothetical protein